MRWFGERCQGSELHAVIADLQTQSLQSLEAIEFHIEFDVYWSLLQYLVDIHFEILHFIHIDLTIHARLMYILHLQNVETIF